MTTTDEVRASRWRRSVPRVASHFALVLIFVSLQTMSACGGSGGSSTGGGGGSTPQVATPAITATAAMNGAQTIALKDSTSGATIYYTLDGSTPSTSSTQYFAPFLLASNSTLKVVATLSGYTPSQVASQSFSPNIASGTEVWGDDFINTSGANASPNPVTWSYDTGGGGWGNGELESYCAAGSSSSPCDSSNPNVYIDTSNILHIVARNPSAGVYTSARMKTEGLFSFSYGRIEAKMKLPEGQGLWPAFWTLGNNIDTVNWPACGELDIVEHIDASTPDWVQGSVHWGTSSATEQSTGIKYDPANFSAAAWHVYGMIWSPQTIQYYVDTPSNIYATSTAPAGGWPFDNGSGQFILLNLAVGGDWPGAPDATTTFPAEIQVAYVHVYTN
jgi:beta-glucanase (GH16 family)